MSGPRGDLTWVDDWRLDVLSGVTWLQVNWILSGLPLARQTTLENVVPLKSEGWAWPVKQSQSWAGQVTVTRRLARTSPATYDAGQEALRSASDTESGAVRVRWYKTEGVNLEAYEGTALVDWQHVAGGAGTPDRAQVSLTGQGPRILITHPAIA